MDRGRQTDSVWPKNTGMLVVERVHSNKIITSFDCVRFHNSVFSFHILKFLMFLFPRMSNSFGWAQTTIISSSFLINFHFCWWVGTFVKLKEFIRHYKIWVLDVAKLTGFPFGAHSMVPHFVPKKGIRNLRIDAWTFWTQKLELLIYAHLHSIFIKHTLPRLVWT